MADQDPNPAPAFDERGRLIAPQYGDIYFSAEDGLAETRHVFLEGNRLAPRFAALRPGETFTIGETGFGTGLNFLAVWREFASNAPEDAHLEFVSVEAAPLSADTIRRALSPWPPIDGPAGALLDQWGPLWPGMHRFRFGNGVRLSLLIGQASEALASIDASVDAWFLDGFAPSRNPDMWSEAVFEQVARLSAHDATLATYTAAGFVRRGLEKVGFEIEKRPGFGSKRDMTVGRLKRPTPVVKPRLPARVVVIGGSLAGSFVARSLAERGVAVDVYDYEKPVDGEMPTLAPRVSVLQPKVNDANDPAGRRLREGYAFAERLLRADAGVARRAGWHPCGAFQAAHDERSQRRARRFVEQFGATGLCRWIDAGETEDELGIGLGLGGVVIDHAGVLRSAGLCAALLDHKGISTHYGGIIAPIFPNQQGWVGEVADIGERIESNVFVAANAVNANIYPEFRHLELHYVRGQVTVLRSPEQAGRLSTLKRAVFYGGYLLPKFDGLQTLGASFERDITETGWTMAEHLNVCNKLARVLPDEAQRLRSIDNPSGWFGYRTVTATGRVCAEQVEPGLYGSLGHGSHGIASAAEAGEHIAALITGGVRTRGAR